MSLKTIRKSDLDSIDLPFECDLIQQANKLFDLLETFADFIKQFPTKEVLQQNIQEGFRDYSLFMKLQGQNPNIKLVPTTMIELIWVSHALRNEIYGQDCKSEFGYTIHHPMEYDNRMKLFKETAKLWKDKYKFPYMQSAPKTTAVDIQWIHLNALHVVEDCEWLPELIKLRPDYRDDAFLKKQKEYYQKMLYIWAVNGSRGTTGPHIAMDIFWHSHILSQTYEEDCKKIVGEVPFHYPKTRVPYHSNPLGKIPPPPLDVSEKSDLDLDQLFVKTFGVHMNFSVQELDPSARDPYDESMPKEIFNQILNNLNFYDLISAAGVNRKWRSATESGSKWRTLYTDARAQSEWSSALETPPLHLIPPASASEHAHDHRVFMPLYLELLEFFHTNNLFQYKTKSAWYQAWSSPIPILPPPPLMPLPCGPPQLPVSPLAVPQISCSMSPPIRMMCSRVAPKPHLPCGKAPPKMPVPQIKCGKRAPPLKKISPPKTKFNPKDLKDD